MSRAVGLAAEDQQNFEGWGYEKVGSEMIRMKSKNTKIVTTSAAPRPDRSFVQQLAAQISCLLPNDLKNRLPTVEEIEAELMRKGRP